MSKQALVTGARGLIGSAVTRQLIDKGWNVMAPNSTELDLLCRESVIDFVQNNEIDLLIHAAARVGGVLGNSKYPANFISDNVRMQSNVIDAATEKRIEKFVFVGSSCIYPAAATIPISEKELMKGPLEPTNRWYATAKIAGIMQVEAVRLQHGLEWVSVLPTNVYGQGDNFAKETGHVVPSLILKFLEAKRVNSNVVEVWGTGKPLREFIHVEDLASAVIYVSLADTSKWDGPFICNLGTGEEVTIKALAQLIASLTGFTGEIKFNSQRPDGVQRKGLDSELLKSTGWKQSISLAEGLKDTINWAELNFDELRRNEVKANSLL